MNFQLFKRKFLIFSCYDLIFSCPEKDRKRTNRYPCKGLLEIDQPETTRKSEKGVSSREMFPISGGSNGVKGRKMSQSGLLDVSTEQQGDVGKYPGECGGRKRKGPTSSSKKAEVDVNVEVGDGQGKRQRRWTRGKK